MLRVSALPILLVLPLACGPPRASDEEVAAGLAEAAAGAAAWAERGGDVAAWPTYPTNPFRIPLSPDQPTMTGRGGIIVHDLSGDGLLDYAISTKTGDAGEGDGAIAVHDWSGRLLWLQPADIKIDSQSEDNGLPGWFGPGIAAGDVDGDGDAELLHLDTGNRIVIRDGGTGDEVRRVGPFAVPEGAERWAQLQLVDLRGEGDRDVILQADPDPFRWLTAVRLDTGETLWSVDDYLGPKHGGFRAADLDGDGRDEVAGGVLIDDDGTRMNEWEYHELPGHLDSVFIADVVPEEAGLEVVLLEENGVRGDDHTALVAPQRVFWYASRDGWEPQNAAIGRFAPDRPGLQVWNRSRFDTDQLPWLLDAKGKLIATWVMNDVKPWHWSKKGIEQIYSIDWDGGSTHYLAAKERHDAGDIAVVDAVSGEFLQTWDAAADRIFVADVSGDAREEIVVVDAAAGEIQVYWNPAPDRGPSRPRLWQQNAYRRQKQNYNYYSP